jgi:hypothetical protein
VNNKEGKARTRSGMIECQCLADGTHEAHVAPTLRDARVTPRFWSLQTQFKGDCAIPIGCAPEQEPATFVEFFAVDDGDEFPPGDNDEPFSDSWPVIFVRARRGSTRIHRGKCMATLRVSTCSDRGCLGRCHCRKETVWLVVPVWEPPTRICGGGLH